MRFNYLDHTLYRNDNKEENHVNSGYSKENLTKALDIIWVFLEGKLVKPLSSSSVQNTKLRNTHQLHLF